MDSDYHERVWKEWLAEVMPTKPKNTYLDSPRGREVTKLCLDVERNCQNWRRSDVDTFWIDVQLFVKYKLDDKQIRFILKQQPGIDNYAKHSEERNVYAEFSRGLDKLRAIAAGMTLNEWRRCQETKGQ